MMKREPLMDPLKVSLVGAGSRSFGPGTISDVLLSDRLCERDLTLSLMDISQEALDRSARFARHAAGRLGRKVAIEATTSLEESLAGASFVVDAVEVSREIYWAMDFHLPRRYGFRQIYGENGGPGSHFHALRNMPLIMGIVRQMEKTCPEAVLLNYTNPMHKLCEAACRLSSIQTIGLCHGVFMGRGQLSHLLGLPLERLDTGACGINHFTWFQWIRDRETGEDLYPRLREIERRGDPLADWHEIGLSRILFRRFGLYPSPGTNHIGEYIGWADEFYASELHYYYDPMEGHPWTTGQAPEFVYSLAGDKTTRPFIKEPQPEWEPEEGEIRFSGEGAIPIMESLACGVPHDLPAVNIPNKGSIPGLPDDAVVEVPATADAEGIRPVVMEALPEPVAALIRTQCSIQKLLTEAYAEESREKLLQALLLEPMVHSYSGAAGMMDEMIRLQQGMLPPLR